MGKNFKVDRIEPEESKGHFQGRLRGSLGQACESLPGIFKSDSLKAQTGPAFFQAFANFAQRLSYSKGRNE